MKSLRELAETWRKDAELLDRYGDNQLATACRLHAEAVESALSAESEEALDLSTAARESGYSADRLRHKVANGEIPNAGRKGSPRIRRGDLPSKGARTSAGFDATAIARNVLGQSGPRP